MMILSKQAKSERNASIRYWFKQGSSPDALSIQFNLSVEQIYFICGKRKPRASKKKPKELSTCTNL